MEMIVEDGISTPMLTGILLEADARAARTRVARSWREGDGDGRVIVPLNWMAWTAGCANVTVNEVSSVSPPRIKARHGV